jgi:hypothetical protein
MDRAQFLALLAAIIMTREGYPSEKQALAIAESLLEAAEAA